MVDSSKIRDCLREQLLTECVDVRGYVKPLDIQTLSFALIALELGRISEEIEAISNKLYEDG